MFLAVRKWVRSVLECCSGGNDDGTSQKALALAKLNSRRAQTWINRIDWIIPGRPNHIAAKKKILQWKNLSRIGRFWDIWQIFLSVLACGMYIAETYSTGFKEHKLYSYTELVVTQFFLCDFLFNWFTAVNSKVFFTTVMTIVDILTIFPVYIGLMTGSSVNLSIFRFIRVLRLVRVLRTFRLLGGLSGLRRQLITLTLTLLSLTFMAAGIVNVLENDVKQSGFDCKYINADTNYSPSCNANYDNSADVINCDCYEHHCRAAYTRYDNMHKPTGINCVMLPFFDCFYYIVVTISTVGYGDISPSTTASRAVVLLFIVTSAVVIPMQLKQLTQILAINSVYRKAYEAQTMEEHVVLCGHVNDKKKLHKFLKEFFHPDRTFAKSPQFHIVILHPDDPTEETRSLLVSPNFDSRVTYLIGSALSVEDLQRARVDTASAVFFLSNIEAKEDVASAEGTNTVLRTLAVSDFNPDAQCLVEVMHTHDSDILKNSDVDIVLCVDEFKSVMLARNAVCPGVSTLVNNIFRTYGGPFVSNNPRDHWLREYHSGESMETYYLSLPPQFLEAFGFEWSVAVEGVYLEFGCTIIGLFETNKGTITLNPTHMDFRVSTIGANFIIILLCPNADTATAVNKGMSDHPTLARMVTKIMEAERKFGVRVIPKQEGTMQRTQSSRRNLSRNAVVDGVRIQDIFMFCKLQRADRKNKSGPQAMGGRYVGMGPGAMGRSKGQDGHGHSKPAAKPKWPGAPQGAQSSSNSGSGKSLTSPSVSAQSSLDDNAMAHKMEGQDSSEVDGQIYHGFDLENHIIVFGCMDNIASLIEFSDLELTRRMDDVRRPFLYVGDEAPHRWNTLRKKHPCIYFMEGDMSDTSTLSRINLEKAHSVVMLAHRREQLDFEEDENLDFEMLFLYLKISSFIPSDVHFTVELTSGQNMGVLNSVAVRKENREDGIGQAGDGDVDSGSSFFTPGKALPAHIADEEAIRNRMKRIYSTTKSRRGARLKRGVFFSQFISRTPDRENSRDNTTATVQRLQKVLPGRRLSSLQLKSQVSQKNSTKRTFRKSEAWEGFESHYNLAIYASGRAFVPDVIDNILCQSFFASMTSNLCEALICGQQDQGIFLIDVPRTFTYRYYGDIFRALMARYVLSLGLYRAPSKTENSFMPFVYTCPPSRTVLNIADKIYVYGAPEDIKSAVKVLSLPFERVGSKLQLGVDETAGAMRRRSMAPNSQGPGGTSVHGAAGGSMSAVERAAQAAREAVA